MRVGLIIETFTHLGLAADHDRRGWRMAIMFVFGAHAFIWGTTSRTVRMRAVPTELQGRVGSVYSIGVFGGILAGQAIGGVVARIWGVTAPFWFAFVGSAIILALIWRQLGHIAHTTGSRRDRGTAGMYRLPREEREAVEQHRRGIRRRGAGEAREASRCVGKGMLVLFIALIACFTAWGVAQDLTTPMVAGFKRIFDMSTFQASLVQLAYFGAYFLLALPAAFINQRFGYKTGILSGLGARRARRVRVLPGEQDHDLRGVPRRPVRDGGGLLDPRDLREPVRHVARLGGARRRGA